MSNENGVIYFCPKCHKTFGGDKDGGFRSCHNCATQLIETQVPVQTWREMPVEQKERFKSTWAMTYEKNMEKLAPANTSEAYLQQIAHDIHFLYIIAVILVVLMIIGFVISFATVGLGAFRLFSLF